MSVVSRVLSVTYAEFCTKAATFRKFRALGGASVASTGHGGTVNRKSFSRFLFLANETADEHLVPPDRSTFKNKSTDKQKRKPSLWKRARRSASAKKAAPLQQVWQSVANNLLSKTPGRASLMLHPTPNRGDEGPIARTPAHSDAVALPQKMLVSAPRHV